MIVTAALYARVSTPNQEEEATIDSQVAAIERYIQKNSYDLPADFYFLDKAVSGARLERPSLDRLRHLASDGAFSVVVCYCPDRLSRNYPHQWVIMDELQRNGVRVEFVNQPDLGNNPQAQLLLGVQGLFAEYERAMIKERLRMGRLYKIRTGKLMHNAPPYGYRYIPRNETGGSYWIIEEREAEAVRQIFAWYTGEEGLTIWAITKRLNQSYPHALRRAKKWQYSIVHKILKRTAYIGRTYFNKERIRPEIIGTPRITGRGKRRTMQTEIRPEEEWIEVEVPALVDEAVWNRAQERLKMNQKFAVRNNKRHFYLLRSLLVCATCGYTLQGRCQKGRIYYYCEHGGKNRYPDVPRHTCSIAGRIIEPLVWEAVAELLQNPQQIVAAWEAEAAKQDVTPDELSRLQARQRKLDRQWVRLLDAFQEELLDKTELGERKRRLEQERQTITERIEQIQRQEKQRSIKAQIIDEFSAFCASAQKALENPTPEAKQEVLRLLVESIVI
ncbi:MAG: recombinase family protein, partial [Chloroflexi bacterium]|nr:recombinase family protein [Chloroflexota bacterium]